MIARLCFAAVVIVATVPPAMAEHPILTLTGAVRDAPVTLTRSDLKALPRHEMETSTSVTDGTQHFAGFLMHHLLAAHDATGKTVQARALNDYMIEIPLSDFMEFDVIGALYHDGKPLSPRDKGPVWIVYPRDDHRDLQDIRYDTRWVWQLSTLHIE